MDAVRSIVQPITHNLPSPLRDLGISLIGPKCYKQLLLDVDLSSSSSSDECLRLAISKGLGLAIVTVSSIVKVPQIVKLLQSQSSSGVSFLAYLLETSALLITLAYNVRNGFPFSTYGESALIMAQNVVIAVLVLQFSGRGTVAAGFVAALAGAATLLFKEGVLDARMMGVLQGGAGVLGVASKVPQIVAIWKQGGTGQLSAFAVFNYLIGSLTRIFTTLQEVDDKLILYGFIAGFALNAILALQMAYYWNAPSEKARGKRKETIPMAPVNTRVVSATSRSTSGPTTRRRG